MPEKQIYGVLKWLFSSLVLLCFTVTAEELTGKVVRVADADTITILDSTATQHKVRLNKIDTPEKGQAFGDASKKHLSGFVFGNTVPVDFKKKDQYGRILGEVYFNATNNLQMVKDGYAWHYKFFDKTPEYAEAEKVAREKRMGL